LKRQLPVQSTQFAMNSYKKMAMNNRLKATDASEENHGARITLSNHVDEKAIYHMAVP
jgi:hypothetical protein